ncbi:hypothetical protein ACWCPT_30000 [Streptomyces sp. NPDC002308]
MKSSATPPSQPSRRLNRTRTAITRHLRKWLVNPGHRVQESFTCGVANRFGDFAASLVIAWLISRR